MANTTLFEIVRIRKQVPCYWSELVPATFFIFPAIFPAIPRLNKQASNLHLQEAEYGPIASIENTWLDLPHYFTHQRKTPVFEEKTGSKSFRQNP